MYPWFLRAGTARLARAICLLCLLLVLGCTSKPKPPEFTEVKGTVLFQGKPLPGGRVTFVSVTGNWSGAGNIDDKGNYKLEAPVGEVKIGVDNTMLSPPSRKGPQPPAAKPMLKRPGSEEPDQFKGHYVDIPEKYHSPEESGLKHTVAKGAAPFDIRLE
jgi:hypothetical protein